MVFRLLMAKRFPTLAIKKNSKNLLSTNGGYKLFEFAKVILTQNALRYSTVEPERTASLVERRGFSLVENV